MSIGCVKSARVCVCDRPSPVITGWLIVGWVRVCVSVGL